jgi:predicted NBD/HSP70 family sugar kinase
VVENDVNLAVLGEHWRGVARGHDTCAFLTLGVGIGAGILIDGVLHRGHHSLAGEIALMCMGPDLVARDFGSRGCLETLAGLDAIVERWRPGSQGDPEGLARALLEAARSDDERARDALREAGTLIAIASSHLSLVIDPSLLVFGGVLVEQGNELLDEIRRIVARVIPTPPQIAASSLGQKAALWGSLLVATEDARSRLRRRLRQPVQKRKPKARS